jgi:hypothetical protein
MTVTPAIRLGATALAGLVALVVGVRHLAAPTRDSIFLVGADTDLSVVYARYSVANTSLVDQQLTTRMVLLSTRSGVLEHRAMTGPAAIGPDGVAAGTDGLVATRDGWEARIGGDALAARITAVGAARGCPPVAGDMAGMVEARSDGAILHGAAVVAGTHAVGVVSDSALYVVSQDFSAGIDPISDCPAWVRTAGDTWTGDAPTLDATAGTDVMLGGWKLHLKWLSPETTLDAFAHLLPPERWAARLFGMPAPHVGVRRAVVRVEGPGVAGARAGVVLTRG